MSFLKIIFKKVNLKKIFFIFIIGLVSRLVVNNYFEVNVFSDFFNKVSLVYYFLFSCFLVIVNELGNFSFLPSFFSMFLSVNSFLIYCFNFSKVNFSLFSLSNIRNLFKLLFGSFRGYNYQHVTDNIESDSVKSISCNDKDKFIVFEKNKDITPKEVSHNSQGNRGSLRRCRSNSRLRASFLDRDKLSNNSKVSNITYDNKTENVSHKNIRGSSTTTNSGEFIPLCVVNSEGSNVHTKKYYDYYRNNRGSLPAFPREVNFTAPGAPQLSNLNTPSDLSSVSPLFRDKTPVRHSTDERPIMAGTVFPEYYRQLWGSVNGPSDVSTYGKQIDWEHLRQRVNGNTSTKCHELLNGVNKEVVNVDLYGPNPEYPLRIKSKNGGLFKLGFRLFEGDFDRIEKVYIKYHDITKRKLMWNIWEKNRGRFGTYYEFKSEFDPNSPIIRTIFFETKSDISNELRSLIVSFNSFRHPGLDYYGKNRFGFTGITSQQEGINEVNARKNKGKVLEYPGIKHKRFNSNK